MHTTPPSVPQRRLARQARQRFVEGICSGLANLDKIVQDFLTALMNQTDTAREMQSRRDAWMQYQQKHAAWTERTGKAWQEALAPHVSSMRGQLLAGGSGGLSQFELLSDDVVENKILASRMALTVTEQVNHQFDTLRQRTQSLEGQELDSSDILRPDTVCLLLVEQWVDAGLSRTDLQMVVDPLQRELANLLQKHYQAVNVFYVEQGITPQVDLKSKVRRAQGGSATDSGGGDSGSGGLASQALAQTRQAMAAARGGAQPGTDRPMGPGPQMQPGLGGQHRPHGMPTAFASGSTPLARARQRAQGVMGQLRRLLTQPATGFDMVNAPPASAALAHALTAHRVQADTYYSGVATLMEDYSPAAVVQLVGAVRERSAELKKKAATTGEKAIIEVVALMFQSILAEDRIPPAVRVWFARLQVPVLRVALAEPEFFSNLDHPARKLIDRMGACVLGFDATSINGSALEVEIRRVVQVIEQYPETGRRVFQLVYDEFEKFLAKFLTEKQVTSRLVSVAQQVEQRETLAIQYTIELRTMLRDMPVRDEIRKFLFKTWAEVLALSAVRDGPQHADTVAFKRTAADLVWAASAKPNRSDRAQVIQNLPALLQRLRQGLTLLGVNGAAQDAQIKVLTDTLADAFLSKTASIPQAHIDAMAKRLANLEDFINDATLGDMPLNADNIEMMLGIDASSIHVIADNGAPVDDAMVAWAQDLQPGTWYTLDPSGATDRVLPIPGWTLPGVYTLGGAQVALKFQGCAIGSRVVLMGTGPLLYLVAYQYVKAGASVAAVLDTARLTDQMAALPAMLTQPAVFAKGVYYVAWLRAHGVPIHSGVRPVRVQGDARVAGVVWADGAGREHTLPCDAVGFGYALRSETQLADLLGCRFAWAPLHRAHLPERDANGRSSVLGVYLAGDGAGIMGADAAEWAGELAALALLQDHGVAVDAARMQTLQGQLGHLMRFRQGLERAFPFPTDWATHAPDALVVCRCENITAGALRACVRDTGADEMNRLKALTRVGMGRCQGRSCGVAAAEILAQATGKPVELVGRLRGQAPIKPIPIHLQAREVRQSADAGASA